ISLKGSRTPVSSVRGGEHYDFKRKLLSKYFY
ncbi:uncharacterized protein METZ01_LOCUS322708, partial [marine metagenome]